MKSRFTLYRFVLQRERGASDDGCASLQWLSKCFREAGTLQEKLLLLQQINALSMSYTHDYQEICLFTCYFMQNQLATANSQLISKFLVIAGNFSLDWPQIGVLLAQLPAYYLDKDLTVQEIQYFAFLTSNLLLPFFHQPAVPDYLINFLSFCDIIYTIDGTVNHKTLQLLARIFNGCVDFYIFSGIPICSYYRYLRKHKSVEFNIREAAREVSKFDAAAVELKNLIFSCQKINYIDLVALTEISEAVKFTPENVIAILGILYGGKPDQQILACRLLQSIVSQQFAQVELLELLRREQIVDFCTRNSQSSLYLEDLMDCLRDVGFCSFQD